jgi:acetylornithine deacetylase/succinyl-diaminopimelate desuccinylase-like protein
MRGWVIAATAWALVSGAASAQAPDYGPDWPAFRGLYEELVEIDTSATSGSCTRAAEAMAVRLRAAGYPDADLHLIAPDGAPQDGNLMAVLHGRSARAPALILLAHIDVVDARREDWERDPFTLIEEDGYFFGRGTADDKSMAAIFTDLMIRLRGENFRPARDVKLVLTCGEETSSRVNGVKYLIERHRDLIAGSIAINEGAGGRLDEGGARVMVNVQAGEKVHQVFQLEVTNPGGHSSRPRADNAIYQLNAALLRLSDYRFPVALNDVTRTFLQRMSPITPGAAGAAMAALAADPADAAAAATLSEDPSLNAMLRTVCTATMLDAGHAPNALAQRARATLSCRILPGQTSEQVVDELRRVLADPAITITRLNGAQPTPPAPPLARAVMAPVERVAARLFPGVPIVPTMTLGATDGRFMNEAGIATYGMSGLFATDGETNAHGLNEKVRVQSLYESRAFLEGVVRAYAQSRTP